MNNKLKSLSHVLPWLGILPFVLGIVTSATPLTTSMLDGETLFVTYSVIILSFMCGTLWGQQLPLKNSSASSVFVITNVWALVSWCVLLAYAVFVAPVMLVLLILCAGYLHLLVIETKLSVSASYMAIRKWVTLCVVALHLVMVIL